MKGYLLDTSAVSILEPRRTLLTPEIQAWFMVREPRLFMSTVAIYEIVQGVQRLDLTGKPERAQSVREWLERVVGNFGQRILPMDLEIAWAAGKMSALAAGRGTHPGAPDIMMAATAQVHGLLLLTQNIRHFADLGIEVANPLQNLPA